MPINITMPALSPTMEEGNLSKWLVKEGDKVKSGDVIAEIETDKATMEVEAVDEGTVAKLVVAAGTEGVKVNALIAVLAADGEDVSAAASGAASAAPAPKADGAAAPKAEAAPAPAPSTPAAAPATTAAPASVSSDGTRTFSSPLARRLAKEAGIDLSAVAGSGPHGRVVKSDIEAAVAGGGAKAAAAPAPAATPQAAAPAPAAAAPKGASEEAVLKLFEPGSYELVPHDGMRKTIAKRLVESKQTIPHFYVSVDCELDALLALRAQLNDAAPRKDGGAPAYKLSVNDMVIKAMALSLRDVPDANVSWTDNNMVKHKHADVGVAVSIPGGLITPIIRKAEQKTLSVISNEMRDLGKRAKDRKLKPEEYQGGTSSVSNMGMMGVRVFSAVINPPHATILAVGAGEQRVVVKKGEMAIATVMSVTLSTDHRCVDGALGAELLQAFKGYIENPMGMLV
ncbi:pyruvate dehydrogenase complex dihydrolipoamide acetyltransferase [Rhizobium leguminosarum bv. viciae 248]|uniref:pyruvate dehydrogenase complex dihydrolipoamide acetyltransferase n=1 Tax=Rhizobium leguminosarum TaxID=384 RepID=UPI000368C4ED|nr:pyruvate dehydrogenase complex dihydrolipoamide acetyltransferase [Rhizobium leguminosarum]MBY5837760.1 pyruvate dehydrogenase complex dihydrolipoamide acetyltransferase [Rhizobium leguminosarum]MCA2411598.1 pyruvate dehydrogenase complex dihydrolipoamide acetyltransferase [Rhizobium leguminosarum]NKM64794.1 pyruvate dehydrogenase complex dihydrolipoamide acetyltransferase [Rhizobium leguminosarum bv. viciae]NKM76379.1 pyruvate dehydrogenase complex dihydrolipoamide acetyltransferase [Rhizob